MSEIDSLLGFYKGRKNISVKDIEEFRDTYIAASKYFSPKPIPLTPDMRKKAEIIVTNEADAMYGAHRRGSSSWFKAYNDAEHREIRRVIYPQRTGNDKEIL